MPSLLSQAERDTWHASGQVVSNHSNSLFQVASSKVFRPQTHFLPMGSGIMDQVQEEQHSNLMQWGRKARQMEAEACLSN